MGVTGLGRLRQLDPKLRPWAEWLVGLAVAQGWDVEVTSVYRSVKEQAALRREWLAGARRLYAAPAGCSQHNYRLAFDLWVKDDSTGSRARALGGAWNQAGGSWVVSDPVHFGVRWTPPEGCR